MSANLFGRLVSRFPSDRSRTVIETEDGVVTTFGDLLERAGRIASLLRASGIEPGDRIVVQVEKSVSAICLYLGILQVGAIYIPLNTAYTPAEVGTFLADAEPRIFVCDPERLGALSPHVRGRTWTFTLGVMGDGTLIEQGARLASERAVAPRMGDDVAAILYTSGTTGRSKGAMLTHDNVWSNVTTLHALWGFRPEDVLIHALPLYHTHGLLVALNLVLLNGGRMILLPKFDPERVIRLLGRASVLMGVPTFYTRMLESPNLTREKASGVRLFISGSAPLLAQTHAAFEERTGQRILERYGMTETGMTTSNPLEGERRPGTVGLALPDVRLRLRGTGGAAAPGAVGVLEVRGPNVFKGYWRMPEKTAEEFSEDGYFITGDLAEISDDGYVSIVGRAKIIITGGLNVYPKEVELAIDALPGIIESAVIGVPHPDFGEAVVAVVAARSDPGDVIGALREQLAAFKLPKHVAIVEMLPRNVMGKVQKSELRNRFARLFGI